MADFGFVTLVAPVAREKLGDETAVALFGARFGAQKRDFRRPGRRVQARGNTAFLHDGEKTCFIRGPIFGTAITLEEFWRRSEQQFVGIGNLADFLEEEREIGMLGKAGKLTVAVLPDVDDLLDAGPQQQVEKLLCRFPGEADGAEKALHDN